RIKNKTAWNKVYVFMSGKSPPRHIHETFHAISITTFSHIKTSKSMKRTVNFTVLFLGLAISANLANAQGVYLHDQEPCGVSAEAERGSLELPEGYLPICTDPNQIKYV